MALIPVSDALAKVLDGVTPLPAETVKLADAFGRVLAEDLTALRTQPPAPLSAMDGYAVRAADAATVPAQLTVIGEVAAGRPFQGRIGPGQAARIFTGGVVPDGADAIVIQEDTTREGDSVTVTFAAQPGRHIRRAGIDFKAGETVLSQGRVLNARDLTLAAATNHATLPAHRRPRITLFGTGDELVMPGGQPQDGEIVYSNGFGLTALAQAMGATVDHVGVVPDKSEAIVAAIRAARDNGADILLTTGGASVGDYDLVQQALIAEGMELSFWKLAMRPGKPLIYGRLGAMRVLGLPGNPVSSFVCAFLFLLPLIRKLSGRADIEAPRSEAVLGTDVPENDTREEYLRATLQTDAAGRLIATPLPSQDSSLTATLARADCLLIRERFAPAAPAGSPCVILKLAL
jgi:molybdopterin molybdotransferase